MKVIPQMLTDETLRARYRDVVQRTSVLRPRNTSAADLERDILKAVTELEEEIAALEQEHRRRGLPLDAGAVQAVASADDLGALPEDVLRSRLEEASKELCTISVRSKRGKQLKRATALEHELRRRGLPLPIDADTARLK